MDVQQYWLTPEPDKTNDVEWQHFRGSICLKTRSVGRQFGL